MKCQQMMKNGNNQKNYKFIEKSIYLENMNK